MGKTSTEEKIDISVPTIPVAEGEEPWTAKELADVREQLLEDVTALEAKYLAAQAGLAELLTEGVDLVGRDPADVGSSNFERDQEMSLAANARAMYEQSELALRMFDEGSYGVCESCALPIGKARLQAVPRATMCVSCKQRMERRS